MSDAVKSWLEDPERIRILGAANLANLAKVAPNVVNDNSNQAVDGLRLPCDSLHLGCECRQPTPEDSQGLQGSQAGRIVDSYGAFTTWRRDSQNSQSSQAGRQPSFAEVEDHLRRIALAARLPWTRMRTDPGGIRDDDVQEVLQHWQDYTVDPRFLRAYIAAVAFRLALDPEFIR